MYLKRSPRGIIAFMTLALVVLAMSVVPSTRASLATAATTGTSASIVASPTSGRVSTTVAVTGSNFGGGEAVNVYWDSTSTKARTATTTTASGTFTANFRVPQAISGMHTIIATDAAGGAPATAPFLVKPKLTLKPTSGTAGVTQVMASGYGFGAKDTITVHWAKVTGTALGNQTTTNSLGTFTGASAITFAVPAVPPGTYKVYAVGQLSKAVSAFTVN
jgi:hypothetical protein